jgi:hypothetical protein
VAGKEAELWHADTGMMEPVSYQIADGRTTVPLSLAPWETVFVVFRRTAKAPARNLPATVESPIGTVEGPWEVSFQADRGAPERSTFDKLVAWDEQTDPGIKYFSGTATYKKMLHAEREWFQSGSHVWINLGSVKNLAEVSLNGKNLGIVWTEPFRVDITEALKPGDNTLQIAVTNGWANRIIGDRQPNATKTYTFTSPKFYKDSSPLWPSGLLGPVKLVRSVTATGK